MNGPRMTDSAAAEASVVANIAEVGALTRSLARQYEEIFVCFGTVLLETLQGTATMADAGRTAMAMADAASASFRDNFPNQPVYACRSACAACCYLFVAVPPGIAEAIAAHIEVTFSAAERAALMTRLDEAAVVAASVEDPIRLRRRCPLLGDDDRCSVYEVRPLTCRAFTSTSVAQCEQIAFDPAFATAGVKQNPALYRIHMEATSVLQETARRRGLPADQKGLARALLDAFKTQQDHPASASQVK
ncbi:YkgJ family cysteine cluster protein [Bradyrhizobium sp. CCGUVB14]|uniref:YkgJ family cysteine cluster protein n=1 Tax=Bradyrhizobium sp. CCGUVB14 TaxID=2949628 RepID=UPI0020B241B9|nr:YkgJ family cysteine cluster protein [Bradyrhizobium sp. CCGUVB14]MCP3446074.1 YkgJ family cysteine cluster protein [Bradyrhizobium sp. CCGUVB14]